MSHSAENFRRGISLFLYLRKLSASESFMDKKRVSRFFVENFLLTVPKSSLWSSLRLFRKIGVSRNFMHNRGYHNFPSKISCLTCI